MPKHSVAKHHSSAGPFGRPVQRMLPLTVGALGIVYGDIGTSPLYSIRETFAEVHRIPVTTSSIFGVLSLIFWSLIVVITVKYVWVVMRADNHGEGGILALTALVTLNESRRRRNRLILAGMLGASLLYGDGAITPAISVLSAVEGLEIAAPGLSRFVVPAAIAILVGLFSIQRRGTEIVGRFFGPVMVAWFIVLAIMGTAHIIDHPSVLTAVNPLYAFRFFTDFTTRAFIALGGVVLVVTGGEALYADLGHFGAKPIKRGWFAVVLPALLLNYFGQGAMLLDNPEAVRSPFFLMAPVWAIYPLVGLATLATVIASQALITGVFSLTHQAIQLGFTPRMEVRHTSAAAHGQVYLPAVNWALLAACVGLVWGFGSSANLAAAYGIAVTATMLITSVLIGAFAAEHWGWERWKLAGVIGVFVIVDLAFLGANIIKIPHGGWFTLVAAALVFFVMTTWRTGKGLLSIKIKRTKQPMKAMIASLARSNVSRIEGTAVYLFANPGEVPPAFLANLRHNHAIHESVVFLSVIISDVPRVPRARRDEVIHHGSRFFQVILRYGFMEEPDVPTELRHLIAEVAFDPLHTTYFLGKEHVISNPDEGINGFRERLFNFMHRNARSAADYFKLPVDRVVEIGIPVEI